MLSLLGSLLGFGTSFLPKVMDYFQDKQDKKHELQLMDKQLEQQIQIGNQKLDMVHVEADIRETEALLKSQSSLNRQSSQWSDEVVGIWAAVISFWFGSRTFNRKQQT